MTALELSEHLQVGAVGIRQHLALLEGERMVQISGLRRSIGRPAQIYTLTSEAETRFPKRYDNLSLELLSAVEHVCGTEGLEAVLNARREAMAHSLRPRLGTTPGTERVAALAAVLAEQGYMCEYDEASDGSVLLTEYNCPVDCVARHYPQLCTQEATLYADLLGTPVICEGTLAQGASCCRYRIALSHLNTPGGIPDEL